MLEKIARHTPEFIRKQDSCRRMYRALNNFSLTRPIYYGYLSHKLKKLVGIHRGQRCFVIGNGPSINEMDLDKLKKEVTIGCNRIYLSERVTPWYYCLEDEVLMSNIYLELESWQANNTIKFIPVSLKKYTKNINNVYLINFAYDDYHGVKPEFTDKFTKISYWGCTVTYLMLQIAYFLGCNPIYLIGIDGVRPNKLKHFYRKDNITENAADYELSDAAFIKAREFIESHGREIYDATLDPLRSFYQRVEYEALFR
jgi:hypothetical protein